MRFYFSSDHLQNTTITNAHHQVIYKVTTPFKPFWSTAISTVWKIIPNSLDAFIRDEDLDRLEDDSSNRETSFYGAPSNGVDMKDNFGELALIEWHKLTTSRIRWGGSIGLGKVDTEKFIPARGFARRTRIFVGPDGHSYRWYLGFRVCSLYHQWDMASQYPIAQYHRYKTGLIRGREAQHGYLDFPQPNHFDELKQGQGDHDAEGESTGPISPALLDMIIVTFIYCEELRKDRPELCSV
ncbi:hypothetical protein BJ138DRAFT_374003 [Hygrophoropsis aurantiaca]|uniref:Uncharacterized protein n=1 Tax=Hygrophoropsis aurantiaca TaxID=72124 RepID=A0ACB8A4Z5_9AGAM|nr:hypothetical protein BJ138DRAFT_374003 [Hygrophoropsis aurantiaca]